MRRSLSRFLLTALLALATVRCSTHTMTDHPTSAEPAAPAAPSAAAGYTVLDQRDDRTIIELPNRMVVIAQRIATSPVVSAQVYIKTGSLFEQKHNGAGLSHFLEHLLAAGSTSTRTEKQTADLLGRIGAQFNASTSFDNVRYYINTSSDHADTAIDLLSDWMQNALITDFEFNRERQVIQREFSMGEGDPGRILWKLTQMARYTHHPARHPVIGYLDEFLQITRDEIYSFYKTMYVPNNMVFVVVGDIDVQQTLDHVAKLWSPIPASPLPAITFPVESPTDHPAEITQYAGIDLPRMRLFWPGTQLADEDDYALDVLATILGQGELSRLVQSVRNEQGLVTSISAYNASFAWMKGLFAVDLVAKPDQLDAAREAVLEQIRKIQEQGVTPDELARAKRKTFAAAVFASQTDSETAARLAGDFMQTGNPDYLDHYAQAIQSITAHQVQSAASRFLIPKRLTTIKLLPLGDRQFQAPTRPAEEPWTGPTQEVELDNTRLINIYKVIEPSQSAEAHAIDAEAARMTVLPNGLRLVVQRNTRLPIVAMQFYHAGGLLADEPGHEGLANAMAQMWMKGTAGHSADDIARQLEEAGAQLSTSSGNSTFYVSSQALAENWSQVFDLMAEIITQPTFPDDQWAQMKPRLLAAIDSVNDTWYGELSTTFREAYFGPEHPWSAPIVGKRSTVEAITPEQLRSFYHEHIAASPAVLAVFGDVDPDAVIQQATRLFATLPQTPTVKVDLAVRPQYKPGTVTHLTSKPVAAVTIGYGPGMTRANDDFATIAVLGDVLSSFPSGRLDQALRGEGPGLVYAVWAGPMTGLVRGYFAITFNTQPATVDEAIERAESVVTDIHRQLVDEDSIERARSAEIVSQALSTQSNAQRASEAALNELYGLGFNGSEKLIAQIRAVDNKALRSVADTYLRHPLVVIIKHDAPAATEPAGESAAAPEQ